jgi:hypothetical protein
MFAAGCAALTFILLRLSWRRSGKRSRGGSGPPLDAQPRPKHRWDGAQKDAEARIDRHQVELHDLARDLTAQIDSKLVLLQHLIAQSDQRIHRLEELLSEIERRRD